MMNFLKTSLMCFIALESSLVAAEFVEITARLEDGTTDTLVYPIKERQALIVSSPDGAANAQLIDTLTLQSIAKRKGYTIVTDFQLSLKERKSQAVDASPESREVIVEGSSPHGQIYTSGLDLVMHTMEVKPDGALISERCAINQIRGSNVRTICLSSPNKSKGESPNEKEERLKPTAK